MSSKDDCRSVEKRTRQSTLTRTMSQPAEELQPTHVERGNERGERNDDAIENDNTNNNGGRMREKVLLFLS